MLREFRTADGEHILESIAKEHQLTSTTFAHIKAFLSGIFRYAKRQGVVNSANPMRDVVLPKGKPAGETHAYSLEEITQMLKLLPEPASTIVAVAAFTGVRKGELRGLLWENYDGEQVLISQSFWRGHALEPKTRQSKAPVPVIAQLAQRLDWHRRSSGNPAKGLMFPSPLPWIGNQSSPAWRRRHDHPENLAACNRRRDPALLYQDSRFRRNGRDAAI